MNKRSMKISVMAFCLLLASSTANMLKAQSLSTPDSTMVSAFAGTGVVGLVDGPATSARFNMPGPMAYDASGNLFVSDVLNHCIRKITPGGIVSVFAGNGVAGFADGSGTSARFHYPFGLAFDAAGNLYVADKNNHVIRKITAAGIVSTFAGNPAGGHADGVGSAASFYYPVALTFDALGNLFVGEEVGGNCIRKVTPAGLVSTFAGTPGVWGYADGAADSAKFTYPYGLVFDSFGNLYVADLENYCIRKITPNGTVSTFAGSGQAGTADGTGTNAQFGSVMGGLAIDAQNNIFVGDFHAIRKMTPGAQVSTLAGGNCGNINGVGTTAKFCVIYGLAFNPSGDLIVSEGMWWDFGNNQIRKVSRILPAPPAVTYLDLPARVCLGSSMNYQPTTNGSAAGATVIVDSMYTGPQKGICRNNNGVFVLSSGDSILRFDVDGNYQMTYNPSGFPSNINAIAADNSGRVYFSAPDGMNPGLTSVSRFDASGYQDFGYGSYPGALNNISAIAFDQNDNLWVTDTSGYSVSSVDTSTSTFATVTDLPFNSGYSFNKPVGLSFGKNNQMFLTDKGFKNVIVRDAATGNYYKYLAGVDTFNWQGSSMAVDTVGEGAIYMTSKDKAYRITRSFSQNGSDTICTIQDFEKDFGVNLTWPTGILNVKNSSGISYTWITDSASNYVKRMRFYYYEINPALPAGLNYDAVNGKITGTPLAASAAQTYSVTVHSPYGTTTSTLNFSVELPTALTNALGAINSNVVNQSDGMTVNYNDTNSCSKLVSIADNVGGTALGKTQVNQTIYPTVATFGTGQFVGRVNDISTQNTNAQAQLKLYLTYQDVETFNTTNTMGVTLSNDTIGKTMQVAVMQLHKREDGHIEQINHSPITANWITQDQNWQIQFPVTKFSEFYVGNSDVVDTMSCQDNVQESIVTNNSYYYWHGDTLVSSGYYTDTLVNATGCDSIVELDLFIDNTTSVITPVLEKGVNVYPNPCNGLLSIDINDPNVELRNIRIANVIGSVVYNSDGTKRKNKIDLSSLQKGIYYVTIVSKQETVTKKIILE